MSSKIIPAIALFQEIAVKTLQQLSNAAKIKIYEKGAYLPMEDCIFYIIYGDVKLFKDTTGGEEIVVDLLSNKHFFGEQALFEESLESYNAQAITNLRLIAWPANLFQRLIYEDNHLAVNFLKDKILKQGSLELELEHVSTQNVEQRLGCLLLKLCSLQDITKNEAVLTLPYDRVLIAKRLNMRPETLTRTLHKLCENGHIKVSGNSLHVKSIDTLIDQTCHDCSQTFPCKKIRS